VADHAGELAFGDIEPEVLEHRELAASRRLGKPPRQALRADEAWLIG
jgi:hypothetical protein